MVSKKKQTPSRSPRRTAPDVEDYLASVPADTRAALMKLRKRIKAIVPTATEVISYQTPTSNTMVPSSPSRRSLTTAVSSSCAQLYRWPSSRRPLLRAVKDSQHLYFVVHFVNRDEGERREYELARTLNAARASTIRKVWSDSTPSGYPACGIGTGLGDVVTNAFEIIGGVCRPTDAHQPR